MRRQFGRRQKNQYICDQKLSRIWCEQKVKMPLSRITRIPRYCLRMWTCWNLLIQINVLFFSSLLWCPGPALFCKCFTPAFSSHMHLSNAIYDFSMSWQILTWKTRIWHLNISIFFPCNRNHESCIVFDHRDLNHILSTSHI